MTNFVDIGGVMELHVLRICVCWGGEVEGGGGIEINLHTKAILTVDVKLALSDFNNQLSPTLVYQ